MGRRTVVEKRGAGSELLHDAACANAPGNWAHIARNLIVNTQTGPVSTCIAALLLVPRWSGIFRYNVCVGWSDSVTADVVTLSVLTAQAFSPAALAGGTAAAAFGQNSDAASQGLILQADAVGGAGITFNGAGLNLAPGVIVQWLQQSATLTGLLTAQAPGTNSFYPSGMLRNSVNTVKAPFTVNPTNRVAIGIMATGTNVLAFNRITFYAEELPLL